MIEACVLIGFAVIIVILRDIRDYLGTISEILKEKHLSETWSPKEVAGE